MPDQVENNKFDLQRSLIERLFWDLWNGARYISRTGGTSSEVDALTKVFDRDLLFPEPERFDSDDITFLASIDGYNNRLDRGPDGYFYTPRNTRANPPVEEDTPFTIAAPYRLPAMLDSAFMNRLRMHGAYRFLADYPLPTRVIPIDFSGGYATTGNIEDFYRHDELTRTANTIGDQESIDPRVRIQGTILNASSEQISLGRRPLGSMLS